jgi:pimeloyl-ACP methyl ester carboxylesterase
LGYGTVDVVGLSYGGRVALVFVRRHPVRVRSMVLSSSATPELVIPLPSAEAGRSALETVFDDCQADTLCNRAFPHPAVELDSVLLRLTRSPARVAVPATRRWQAETAAWTREGFAEAIFGLLYDVAHARKIPYWVHQAFEGNLVPFAEETVRARRIAWSRNDYGLTLSVVCSEDAPYIDTASVRRATAEQPLGAPLLASVQGACSEWPRATLPADEREPVESGVPTLIVSGARDPTGATQASAVAARHLPNSLQVVTPYYGHSEVNTCLLDLITTFIERPEPSALDTSCAWHPHVPPFAINTDR